MLSPSPAQRDPREVQRAYLDISQAPESLRTQMLQAVSAPWHLPFPEWGCGGGCSGFRRPFSEHVVRGPRDG